MSSLTSWTWVWAISEIWWWTSKPGMMQTMGSQRVRHDWVTELSWKEDYSNYHTIVLISHASKVMLKILQSRLQQYVNWELSDVQTGFWKGRGTRNQIANTHWIIEKARNIPENIYICFIAYAKSFSCMDYNKLWKILQEMEIPDHVTWLLRSLHEGQEATVKTGHRTTDWFKIEKGVCQGCVLLPAYLTHMQSTSWEILGWVNLQAGIKIAKRNISSLRYADNTTLMAEGEEKLNSLLMRIKEESEKPGLKH